MNFGGSCIGSPTTSIPEMLKFATEKGIQPWIKKWEMDRVNEAVPDMHNGGARYRHVLVNTKNGGSM